MDSRRRPVPVATSTPVRSVNQHVTDLDVSRSSVRSRRKVEHPPQRRTETGTEVLYVNTNVSSSVPGANQRQQVTNPITIKKKRKRRSVARMVLAEIRYLQKTTDPLLRRASFARVVRSIAQRMNFTNALNLRWQSTALECLQEAAEAFIVDFFSFAARAAAHAHRVTVMLSDIHFVSQFYQMLR